MHTPSSDLNTPDRRFGPLTRSCWPWAVAITLGVSAPWILIALDCGFYIGLLTKMLILGLAACSLNLILGYGGLISFGHAAYLGAGAYATAMLMGAGISNAWICLFASIAVSGVLAILIGLVSLRTRGVYFIMITLAFAQMMYYLINSIKSFGGDEGINLSQRFTLGLGEHLKKDLQFYWLVLLIVCVSLFLMSRLIHSKFGRVLQALKDDDTRVESIGIHAFQYKLVAFTLSAMLAGLAGALLVNQQKYVGPNVLYWTQSGLLMIMVILGGVGTLSSGLWGAITLLGLETILAEYTTHGAFYVGWVLLAVVLLTPQGLSSLLPQISEWMTRGLGTKARAQERAKDAS